VLREGPGSNVASEETHTLIVNAHGALIHLALTVEIGQLLGIKNTQTMEELVCRVVSLGLDQPGKREVGSSLNFLLCDSGESPFRRPTGRRVAPMRKPQRRTRPAVEHPRRKRVAYRPKLTKD
jgi:hypothetical protein